MKKIFGKILILICLLILGYTNNVYAVELDADEISTSTYIIGKCMFTRDISNSYSGSLSTDVIMLASKTIESNNLEDMIIYYKNARGIWVNALTSEPIEIEEKIEVEYKNNDVYVETPTLTSKKGNGGISKDASFEIHMEGYYAIEGNLSKIDGWELYEKEGNSYNLLDKDVMHEICIGETKTYVARAYALNKDNEKIYSEYSNEFVIDNSKVEAPTLTSKKGNGGISKDAGFEIHMEGYYAIEGNLSTIDGWELYEKEGNSYNLLDKDVMHEICIGETKTYVARAYALNNDGEKVYSEYSNEVIIDNSKVETPTLKTGKGTIETIQYFDFTIYTEGHYAIEANKNTIDGWELYEKVEDSYNLLDKGVMQEIDAGETKTYVARAYALNKDNEKVYSEYSNEVIIDNSKVETPTLKTGKGTIETIQYFDFTIYTEGYYAIEANANLIDGWELYEKVEDSYNLLDKNVMQEIDAGETKTYVARAYALNKDNEKVYSEYSNEVIIDNSKVETPTLTDTIGDGNNYHLNIFTEGYYAVERNTNLIDGWELYEKVGNEYELVDSKEKEFITVTIDIGETKTYVARAYSLNKENEKVYSEYSNEVILDNSNQ